MRLIVFSCLVLVLAALAFPPVAAADPLPDYGKILQIHLNYQENSYTVSSIEVKYGKAPRLTGSAGNLKGSILDSKGTELRSVSLQEPGIGYGDSPGAAAGDNFVGYTTRPASGNMVITLPYQQDMQKFSLSDIRDGSLLVSADISPTVATFCTDYPSDPDCLARVAPAESAVPDTGAYLALATLFSLSVCMAAGLAIFTLRRRREEEVPEKKVVLIVDDEPDIVNLIDIFLTNKGYATLKASSGKECLDILKSKTPDLMLLDVRMEPMNGWQTLEEIKKNPKSKSVPVLMLTGKRLTPQEAKQYRICIEDYIMKPFQAEGLYEAIDDIFARKQKLADSLVLARKAGIETEKFCEFASLTRRISMNKKIIGILDVPQAVPQQADLNTLDDMLVVDYINVKTKVHEKRAEQLRQEINSRFRSRGLPELSW